MSDNVDLVVVGSVALDSVQSPAGKVEEALGGSAVYFSLAASFFCKVGIVAVVGEDFPDEHRSLLQDRGVDLSGLATERGETFRWSGVYSDDFSTRQTLETRLNVFAEFKPEMPQKYLGAKHLFLGNISPQLQAHVLRQIGDVRVAVADTMNFWIDSDREAVVSVLRSCHGAILNDEEARSISGENNLIRAVRFLVGKVSRFAVLKKGEHGCLLAYEDKLFSAPAYPVSDVRDPTGAGDSFAGGFMGYLAHKRELTWENMKAAAAAGTAIASFGVEGFSADGLIRTTPGALAERIAELAALSSFSPPEF